jgi:phosphonate transport system substrate-binding protein
VSGRSAKARSRRGPTGSAVAAARVLAVLLCALLLGACSEREVGSKKRPFTMYFVPSMDAQDLATNADVVGDFVAKRVSMALYGEEGRFHVRARVPMNYVAVVEAFGAGRADFAALNTFGYVLGHDIKGYPMEAVLMVLRGENRDETSYAAQIVVRTDSDIRTVEDLSGRSFAFTDPSSSAGFLLPMRLFNARDITLGNVVFTHKHDSVISMVYQGQVEAGATYYSPPRLVDGPDGPVEVPRDARSRVLSQYPDVMEHVRILTLTDHVVNEPWVMRSDLHPDPERHRAIRDAVVAALLEFTATPEGVAIIDKLYNVRAVTAIDNADYAAQVAGFVEEVEEALEAYAKGGMRP